MTATATWATIRAAMESAIRALVPGSHAAVTYQAALDEQDFREWAAANPEACLRRYTIARHGDELSGVTNTDVELRVTEATLTVAYPTGGAWYGADNLRSLDDVADADARQLDRALGLDGSAGYATGVHAVEIDREPLEVEGPVAYLPLALRVTYYEGAA